MVAEERSVATKSLPESDHCETMLEGVKSTRDLFPIFNGNTATPPFPRDESAIPRDYPVARPPGARLAILYRGSGHDQHPRTVSVPVKTNQVCHLHTRSQVFSDKKSWNLFSEKTQSASAGIKPPLLRPHGVTHTVRQPGARCCLVLQCHQSAISLWLSV